LFGYLIKNILSVASGYAKQGFACLIAQLSFQKKEKQEKKDSL
jgi:hypothetical protein